MTATVAVLTLRVINSNRLKQYVHHRNISLFLLHTDVGGSVSSPTSA